MKRIGRIVVTGSIIILLIVLVGPFLVPVPPLKNTVPPEQLADPDEIRIPALVITGDDDRIVPTEQSIRLAGKLPDANLVVIPNCGHVP